jgi:hypothetical protein
MENTFGSGIRGNSNWNAISTALHAFPVTHEIVELVSWLEGKGLVDFGNAGDGTSSSINARRVRIDPNILPIAASPLDIQNVFSAVAHEIAHIRYPPPVPQTDLTLQKYVDAYGDGGLVAIDSGDHCACHDGALARCPCEDFDSRTALVRYCGLLSRRSSISLVSTAMCSIGVVSESPSLRVR